MERSTQSVATLARQADELDAPGRRDAEEGGASVQRSIQGIGRVRESMAQSATVMREMGKRTNDISSIVDTINLIAERTNLLSLNASIEAARAGDAGRGFAVVAEEIRNLADRSAKATADIAAIIKALQEVAQEAVAASNDGLRVADDSNLLAEERRHGAEQDPRRRVESGDAGRREIARATDEQQRRGAVRGRRRSAPPPSRPGWLRRRPTSRRHGRRASSRRPADAQDRAGSHQGDGRAGPRRARHPQGRAEHDKDQAAQVRKATAEQAQDRDAASRRPPTRCAAARRRRRARLPSRRPRR